MLTNEMSGPDTDYEAIVDRALQKVSLTKTENARLPCRDLEYPVPTWSEAELRSVSHAAPLLSTDTLHMAGSAAVVTSRPATTSKPSCAHPPPEDDTEIDLSFLNKDVGVAVDAKWADSCARFQSFLQASEAKDTEVQDDIDDLLSMVRAVPAETVRLPDTLNMNGSDGASEEKTSTVGDDILHLSDISDDEDRGLVDITALQQLQEGFAAENAARRREEAIQQEEARVAVTLALEERSSRKAPHTLEILPESTQETLQEVVTPILEPILEPTLMPTNYEQIASEARLRDMEFSAGLEMREAEVARESQAAALALEEEAEARREEGRQRAAREAEEERVRVEREEARMRGLVEENARRRAEDRARFCVLRQQGETLRMEAAEVESHHAALLLQERARRDAAVLHARRVAFAAEADERLATALRPTLNAENLARDVLLSTETSGRDELGHTLCQLNALLAAQQNAVLTCLTNETAGRDGLGYDATKGMEEMVVWVGETLKRFVGEVEHLYEAERGARGVVVEGECTARHGVIGEAECDHMAVEKVLTEVAVLRRRRAAYNDSNHKTAQGQVHALAMLRRVCPTTHKATPPPRPKRSDALRLQETLRNHWLQFFDPAAIHHLQQRRVMSAGWRTSPLNRARPISEPPQPLSGTVVLDDTRLQNYDPSTTSLTLTLEGVKRVQGPFQCLPQLDSLHLANNEVEDVTGTFPSITDVDLTENKLTSTEFLAGFPNLRRLRVDSNSSGSLKGISCCNHLQDLSARHNCVAGLSDLKQCEALIRLDVFGNNLSSLDLPEVSSLTYLNAARNALGDVTNVFRSCPLLLEAHLFNNRITAIPSRMNCVLLRSLQLADNFMREIPDLTHLPCLTLLNVSSNRLTDSSGMRGCLHLKVVELSFNELNNIDAFVQSVEFLQRLTHLNINDNPMWTEAPEVAAAVCAALPALQQLNNDRVNAAYRDAPALPSDTADETYGMRAYDDACLCQIREMCALDAAQRTNAVQHNDAVHDLAVQHLQVHATHGTAHLQHTWTANTAYAKRKHQVRVCAASAKIARWYRRMLHRREQMRKQTRAAVKVQALFRGVLSRTKLERARWVDDDPDEYGEVSVDFAPAVDTSEMSKMGEIFEAFSRSASHQPPVVSTPVVQAPPRASSRTPLSTPTPTPPTHSRERGDTPPTPVQNTDQPPLTEAAMVWVNGSKKRGKRFKMMKKRRQEEERYLSKEKRLEGKVEEVTKIIARTQCAQQQAAQDAQRREEARRVQHDLELESVGSTLTSLCEGGAGSFRRGSMPLPPLRPSSSSHSLSNNH